MGVHRVFTFRKRTKGFFVVCDRCDSEHEFEVKTFPALLNELEREGWRVVPGLDKWRTYCEKE